MKKLLLTITLSVISTLLLVVITSAVIFYTSSGYNYTAPEFYIKICTTDQLINTILSYPKLNIIPYLNSKKGSSWPPYIKELDERKDTPEKALKRFEKCEKFQFVPSSTIETMYLAKRYSLRYTEEQMNRFMSKVEMLEMTSYLNW